VKVEKEKSNAKPQPFPSEDDMLEVQAARITGNMYTHQWSNEEQ
jgi:hypothetical protein